MIYVAKVGILSIIDKKKSENIMINPHTITPILT